MARPAAQSRPVTMAGIGTAEPANRLLELVGVRAAYGRIEVLHGVDLAVPGGRGRRAARPQRRRQVDHPQGGGRAAAPDGRRGPCRRPRRDRGLGHDLARIGVCTIPEGRGVFPNLTVRENLWMATQVSGRLSRARGGRVRPLPPAGRAAHPARRHDVGRRAADAGDVAGARHRPGGAAARRAVDGAGAASSSSSSTRSSPRSRSEGVSILVVEQFARTVLGIADRAAIMVNGVVAHAGTPAELQSELSTAYLGERS